MRTGAKSMAINGCNITQDGIGVVFLQDPHGRRVSYRKVKYALRITSARSGFI